MNSLDNFTLYYEDIRPEFYKFVIPKMPRLTKTSLQLAVVALQFISGATMGGFILAWKLLKGLTLDLPRYIYGKTEVWLEQLND